MAYSAASLVVVLFSATSTIEMYFRVDNVVVVSVLDKKVKDRNNALRREEKILP
jgi:hypothetical protein